MKSHIELVTASDLMVHIARLPGAAGVATERRMSTDEETGGATTLLEFSAPWTQDRGYFAADTEWFVISGSLTLGDRVVPAGGYYRAPRGLVISPLAVDAGTIAISFRDGPAGFVPSELNLAAFVPSGAQTMSGTPGELTVVSTSTMPWAANFLSGDCQRHQMLESKLLYQDPFPSWGPPLGGSTSLLRFPAGWRDELFEHEPHNVEVYILSGTATYNFGQLAPGRYVHRPAGVKSGDYLVGADQPLVMLVRNERYPRHWTTVDPTFEITATALNYDPEDPYEAPGVVGLPLRSRSTGQFSSDIR